MKISVNGRTWTYEVQDECVIVISPKKKITIEIEEVSKKGIFNLGKLSHYLRVNFS